MSDFWAGLPSTGFNNSLISYIFCSVSYSLCSVYISLFSTVSLTSLSSFPSFLKFSIADAQHYTGLPQSRSKPKLVPSYNFWMKLGLLAKNWAFVPSTDYLRPKGFTIFSISYTSCSVSLDLFSVYISLFSAVSLKFSNCSLSIFRVLKYYKTH